MKILILGGNGFLGRSIAGHLATGHEVLSYDRSIPQDAVRIGKHRNIKYFEGDFGIVDSYISLLKECDTVIDLIGLSGSMNSIGQVLQYNKINIDYQIQLLEEIRRLTSPRKIIFASSRLVYGRAQILPVAEGTSCMPLDFYGLQKRTIEEYSRIYSELYDNVNVIILRITNPYGFCLKNYKLSGYNFINNVFFSIKNREEIVLFGDACQLRDYIYIDDVVRAFELVLFMEGKCHIFNVGSGEGQTILGTVQSMHEILGMEPKIRFVEWPKENAKIETGNFVADIKKLISYGWRPCNSFIDGIKDMDKHYGERQ